jgi:hypothetical protein
MVYLESLEFSVFSGTNSEKYAGFMGQVDLDHTSVEGSLQTCTKKSTATIWYQENGTQARRACSDSLVLKASTGVWTVDSS